MITTVIYATALLGLFMIYWLIKHPLKTIIMFFVCLFFFKITMSIILMIGNFLTWLIQLLL